MKRLRQLKSDDCLRSCVASLLEIPCADVPLFTANKGGEHQCAVAQRWLERTYGLTMATILVPHGARLSALLTPHDRPVRFIAVVPVNGGKDWHAVCAAVYGERLRVIHDPGGWGRIRLSLANEIRLLLPVWKRGTKWRPLKYTESTAPRGRTRGRAA
jgi:hypothetical protein